MDLSHIPVNTLDTLVGYMAIAWYLMLIVVVACAVGVYLYIKERCDAEKAAIKAEEEAQADALVEKEKMRAQQERYRATRQRNIIKDWHNDFSEMDYSEETAANVN